MNILSQKAVMKGETMQEYLNVGKQILQMFVNNGFEAFFVGEVVRNIILKKDFERIDIISNASLNNIYRLFIKDTSVFSSTSKVDEYTYKVIYKKHVFYLHTYKLTDNNFMANNRSVSTIHYSHNLLEDLSSKDCTINSIAMNANDKIIDAYHGIQDIHNKKIRCINNPKRYYKDNPLEMLEAIKLVAELNFKLIDKTAQAIRKQSSLIAGCRIEDVIPKLRSILKGKFAKRAIYLLIVTNLYKYLFPFEKGIKAINNNYEKVDFEEFLLLSFIQNGKLDESFAKYINNFELFKKTYYLAIAQKKCNYDSLVLFSNGLNVCLEANFLNYILGKSRLKTKKIQKAFDMLPITSHCKIAYKGDEILRITGGLDARIIEEIQDGIILKILNHQLDNNYKDIEVEVIKALSERKIPFDLNRQATEEDDTADNNDETYSNCIPSEMEDGTDELNNHRVKILEEQLDQKQAELHKKEAKILAIQKQRQYEVCAKLVDEAKNEIINDPNLSSMIQDMDDFEMAYRRFLINYLNGGE